jgi:SAM-dependent methyltransferase
VLDAGCGPGFLWEQLAAVVPAGLRVTLSDLSPGMLAEGVDRARGAGIDVVDARTADNEALPFADGAFDIVLANFTLHHAPDPDRGVAELTRVLAPTGVLVAAANGPDHLRELNDVRAVTFGAHTRDGTAKVFGRTSAPALLERRFAEVTWHRYDDELVCTDLDDVMAYARSCPPAEDATPAELDRLRATLRARFEAGDGTLRITKDCGAFVSRRPVVTPDR